MSALLDPRYFPSLAELPTDHTEYGGDSPGHHWCFMAQITEDDFATRRGFRHWVTVRDRDGASSEVRFHLDEEDILDTTHLKKGNTLFVRYACFHRFMDGSIGLRIEEPTFVYVVPSSLSSILEAQRSVTVTQEPGAATTRQCRGCLKPSVNRCAKCKQVHYCSKECQTTDWKEHRPICRILGQLAPVMDLDYRAYHGGIVGTPIRHGGQEGLKKP